MEKRLTIAELSEVLNISVQATNKKVKKRGLKTTKELINNRLTTIVLLTKNELNDLISSSIQIQPVKQEFEEVFKPVYNHIEQPVNNQLNKPAYEEILNRVLDFTENAHAELKDLYKQIAEKDSQVRLLEDSERRKENEYLRQIAELKTENSKLKKEIDQLKSPWWKRKGL
jgi:hypothetical protein